MGHKPNILFVMTDQQSANMMSCSGTSWVNTPNLDKLANNGIRFSRAYCGNPVCVPSRFSIFTGKLPETIGLRSNSHKKLQSWSKNILKQGMGHVFKQGGYQCVYAGKQHFPGYSAKELGFDILTTDEREKLADESCKFIKEKHDKPWLLVTSFINPHDVCFKGIVDWLDNTKGRENDESTIEYITMKKFDKIPEYMDEDYFYNKVCPKAPLNMLPQQDEPEILQDFLDQREFKRYLANNYSIKDWRMHRYIYKKLTELMDVQVGKVLNALEQSGQINNTLVVFTSDHGDMDGSHRFEHKTVLYEEAIKIPLIISHKGKLTEGITSDILCSNALDLYPTLLEYVGIKVPKDLNGINMINAVKSPEQSRKYVPIESEIGRCIVTKNYRYVKYDFGKNNEQLYDYVKDPLETKNHINNLDNKNVVVNLKSIFNMQWSKTQQKGNPSPLLKGKLRI